MSRIILASQNKRGERKMGVLMRKYKDLGVKLGMSIENVKKKWQLEGKMLKKKPT